LTSTYVEGAAEKNPMMRRGYSRDHRPDCEQMVIALIVNSEGFPFSYETFNGNRADVSTMETILRMALVGRYERLPATRAYQLGIISQVVDPPERLRDEAQALAETIARNSPAAMAATKRALWGALETGLTDACRAGAAELVSLWGHPDQDEGPRAFTERREAHWADPAPSPDR
jgi:hypothetical protein